MTARTYWVSDEGDGFVHERPFRSLEKAQALALKTAIECSWKCLTPTGADNDQGNGKFLCGTLSAHGIHIRAAEDGLWGEEFDVPEEPFKLSRGAGPHNDWALNFVIDRGTGYLADGEDTQFFTGPEPTEGYWDSLLESIAGDDEIVEATVQPTSFGRYHHLIEDSGDYPKQWRKGYGF